MLRDFNIIDDANNFEVLDAAKIRREKIRIGAIEVKESKKVKVKCVGTDGKRVIDAKCIKETLGEDGETYFTHTTDTIDYYTYTIESGTIYLPIFIYL